MEIAVFQCINGKTQSFAEHCKIFVGSEIKGIPYNVLDKMGFNTWELEGYPKEFLGFVFDSEEELT